MEAVISSVIAGSILAIIVFLVIRKIINDRKSGKNSCGCDCSSCSGFCQNKNI